MAYVIYSGVKIMLPDGTEAGIDALMCNYKEDFVNGSRTPAVFYSSVKSSVDQALKGGAGSSGIERTISLRWAA